MTDTIKQMTDKELVDACIYLDHEQKEGKKSMDRYKAELQARGIASMDDHNVKMVEYYGEYGSAAISEKYKLDVISPDKLKDLIGKDTWDAKVKISKETKYKLDSRFEKMLKSIFAGSYTFECTMEDFLDDITLDPKKKKLLLKKLKGEFKADKDLLVSLFGEGDYDVELWYIHRIRNAELIRMFLPEEYLEDTIEKIRKCIIVDSSLAITLNYEEG